MGPQLAEQIKHSALFTLRWWENFGGDPFFSLTPWGRYRLVALTLSLDLLFLAKDLSIAARAAK